MKFLRYWSFVLFAFPFSLSHTQAAIPPTKTDTTVVVRPSVNDSLLRSSSKSEFKKFQPRKRPWVAVGLSAVLPGLGQIYNETYWKVPLIWGLGGYWVSEWIQQNNHYQEFRDKYSASITPQLPSGNGQYLQLRDFYRDERDSFAWYLGALYFLNLVDAYVGANLYDFDVTPDLGADGKLCRE